MGQLLKWVNSDFYHVELDEDERIRIWSQKAPKFQSDLSKLLKIESPVS